MSCAGSKECECECECVGVSVGVDVCMCVPMGGWQPTLGPRPRPHTGDKLPPALFTSLLEGNANVQGCGPLTLPSGADLDGVPQKIKDRLNAIKSVDLREDTIGFKVKGDASHTRTRTPACVTRNTCEHTGRFEF